MAQARSYDYLFKVLLIGDSDVGKTRLMSRFCPVPGVGVSMIGVDFQVKIFDVNGKRVKVMLWDTAGQERFMSITSSYFRGAKGFLLVYDVRNRRSFDNISSWLRIINDHCEGRALDIILVGNNDDDNESKVVSTEEAEAFAQQSGMQLFEVSSTDHARTDEMFLAMAKKCLQTHKDLSQGKSAEVVTLAATKSTKQQCS